MLRLPTFEAQLARQILIAAGATACLAVACGDDGEGSGGGGGSTATTTTGGSTTCDLAALSANRNVRVPIVITPEAIGALTCTAQVSSATGDPNPTNQSMSMAVEVR